jgi:hypothetical protein
MPALGNAMRIWGQKTHFRENIEFDTENWDFSEAVAESLEVY